ncbi:MAG: NYN domain-containing protein [Cellvibrionaceae bacterium]|nr:NYN domain-containing protein [Cellvibrionaceae bacterium]
MPRKFAILIDAGFIKRKLGSQQNPMTAQQVVDFTDKIIQRPELADYELHRIYYYDAEPMTGTKPKPLTGSRGNWGLYDFSATDLCRSNMALLDELKKKPYFAIRLGEVNFRGWLVKPQKLRPGGNQTSLTVESDDLIPNIQQKGVDMRIGLDISALTLKEHVDVIALITGDSDFIPALKFARREGKQTFLYSLGHGIRPEVYAHTDICIEKTADDL